jgi:hypothetical protein
VIDRVSKEMLSTKEVDRKRCGEAWQINGSSSSI